MILCTATAVALCGALIYIYIQERRLMAMDERMARLDMALHVLARLTDVDGIIRARMAGYGEGERQA